MEKGVVVTLVESKAKPTTLDQKGDVIKAELCGAVFATRLKRYCHIQIDHLTHFVDSQPSWEPTRRTAIAMAIKRSFQIALAKSRGPGQ